MDEVTGTDTQIDPLNSEFVDAAPVDSSSPGNAGADLVTDELLVEEISIDGMCGVY